MNTDPFAAHQIAHHEQSMHSASTRLLNVRTTLELARAVNHAPQAPSYIKCFAQDRTADTEFTRAAEMKAKTILTAQVEHLRSLVGSEEFCQESNRFRQEVRLLHHAVPIAARAALMGLFEIQRSIESLPLPLERPRT